MINPKMATYSRRCLFLIHNLDFAEATGIDNARPEHFQVNMWNDDTTFRHDRKSRQIAYSWTSAANAVARAILDKRESIFISINEEESQEKIRYAQRILGAIRLGGLPSADRASMSEIEFSNGVRISSFPAKAARGRSGADIYLDEFAHVRDAKIIYSGSLPVTTKGGRVWMGSSPLGSSGTFWEIGEQKLQPYPGYYRKVTPWWEIYSFCNNVKEARKLAPLMGTRERVVRYGVERIINIYLNMPEEDFQQEYECIYVDETTAWITWEEIRAAQTYPDCVIASAKGTLTPELAEAVATVKGLIRAGKIEPALAGGVDIGRKRNTTEIFLVGISTSGHFPLRLMITLDAVEFDDQLAVILTILDELPITSMLIDATGIGSNLAENAAKLHPVKVAPMNFTNALKTVWATDAKQLIQQHRTPIPNQKDLAYQIHSIKKKVTASNNVVFDTEKNEKHHADKFWAWALALAGAYHPLEGGTIVSSQTFSREAVAELFGERAEGRASIDPRLAGGTPATTSEEWSELADYFKWDSGG